MIESLDKIILAFGLMGIAFWGAFNLLREPNELIAWTIKEENKE